MLHTLKGNGFNCLFTLVSIKMEHPRPLQVCTNVCIIFAHTGAGVIRYAARLTLDNVCVQTIFCAWIERIMCVGEGAMEIFCSAVSVHTHPELQITRGVHQGSHPCTAQGKKYIG